MILEKNLTGVWIMAKLTWEKIIELTRPIIFEVNAILVRAELKAERKSGKQKAGK